jgi:hypothetical protein
MVTIEQNMKATIRDNEDLDEDLQKTQAKGAQLRDNLDFWKRGTEMRQLDQLRTVCTHHSCVEYRDREGNPGEKTTTYKTHCHSPCFLDDAPPNILSPPQLIDCYAFYNHSEHCRHCKHRRGLHQHVLWEHYDTKTLVKDVEFEKQVAEVNDEIELKEKGIAKILEEIRASRAELQFIQSAAARFGFFLEKSILLYNDAMVEYLNHLIRQEMEKVNRNDNVSLQHLKELEASPDQYLWRIDTLDRHMGAGNDGPLVTEDDLDTLMTQLYSLKHWGQNLERL